MSNKSLKNAYIIGAGVTGLSTAYFLSKSKKYKVTVFETQPVIGGMSATFKHKDLILDLGPHKFFSNLKNREKEVLEIIGDKNILKIKKRSQIRLFNRFIDFPVGPVDIFKINPFYGLKMGVSYALVIFKKIIDKSEENTYSDYLKNRFGQVTYNLTFAPYAEKIWTDPNKLDKELASTRVAAPSLFEMVKQMIFKVKSKTTISADFFHYPKKGSGTLTDKLSENIKSLGGQIQTNTTITKIFVKNNKITSLKTDNHDIKLNPNDLVISTIPLEDLSKNCQHVSNLVGKSTQKLTYKNMILVYVVINRKAISNQNWYFFPENKYIFNRVFEQKSFSHYMIPKEKTILCCEITCDPNNSVWQENNDLHLIQKTVDQLIECHLITKNEILETFTKRIDHAYPIYFVGFRKTLNNIFNKIDKIKNLYSIGRQGGYNYVGMIDCFDIGAKTSSYITRKSTYKNRRELRDSFFKYIVID